MSKEKIFALLSAQAGDFVSGEDISAQLGISRAAVWKAVGALRRDGYTIEAQTGLGYRLADSPDVLSERELRRRLGETKIVGRTLECFESVDSTNSYLKRIAAEGAPDGAVAVADEQTAGRGRRGRSFSSGPGRGVYLSALLRPQLAPEKILPLTALGAVAACDAVERTCGVRPQIKWTNDLVLNGKKLSGTLTELSLEGESGALQYAVIGIGVNCNNASEDFPPELREVATSLYLETGKRVQRAALAAALIEELDQALRRAAKRRYGVLPHGLPPRLPDARTRGAAFVAGCKGEGHGAGRGRSVRPCRAPRGRNGRDHPHGRGLRARFIRLCGIKKETLWQRDSGNCFIPSPRSA